MDPQSVYPGQEGYSGLGEVMDFYNGLGVGIDCYAGGCGHGCEFGGGDADASHFRGRNCDKYQGDNSANNGRGTSDIKCFG